MGKKEKSDEVSDLAVVVGNAVILPLMVIVTATSAVAVWAICQTATAVARLFMRLQGAKEEFVAPRGDD